MTTPPPVGPLLKIPTPSVGVNPESLVKNPLAANQPDWVALAKASRSSLMTPLQPQMSHADAIAKANAIIKALSAKQANTVNGAGTVDQFGRIIGSPNIGQFNKIPDSSADVPSGGLVPQIQQELKQKGYSFDELPYEAKQKIIQANFAAQKKLNASNNHPSILGRVLDVISRPLYGVANTVDAAIKGTNPLEAAWRGVEGKDKTTFSKVLGDAGVHNSWVKGIGGFVGDVALDPTTYLTLGTAKIAQEGAKGAEAADKAINAARDASVALKGSQSVSSILEHLTPEALKGIVPTARQASIVTANAAQHVIDPAHAAVIAKAAEQAANVEQAAHASIDQLLRSAGLRPTDPGWAKLFNSVATRSKLPFLGNKKLPDVLKEITDQGSRDAHNLSGRLSQIVHEATNPDYTRRLQLRLGKTRPLASVKLPAALETLGKGERAGAKALGGLIKTFSASSMYKPVNPERLIKESDLASKVSGFDREVANGLHGATSHQVRDAFTNLRNGAFNAGRATKGAFSDGAPVVNDVHFLNHMFSRIETHLAGLSDAELKSVISRHPSDLAFKGLVDARKEAGGSNGWLVQYLKDDPLNKFSKGKYSNPKTVLHVFNHMVAQHEVLNNLYSSLRDLGHHALSPSGVALAKQGYRVPHILGGAGDEPAISHFKDTVFHPDTARAIENLHHLITRPEHINGLLHGYDRALQMFKASVTRYLPSFHARNMFNEILNNFQAGVPFTRGNYYGRALKVLHSHGLVDRSSVPTGMSKSFAKKIARASQSQNLENVLKGALHTAPVGKSVITTLKDGTPLSIDQVWNLFVKHGGPTNFIGRELHQSLRSERGLAAPLVAAQHGAQKAADVTELFPRLAHFIYRLEKEYANPRLISRTSKNVVEKKMNKLDAAAQLAMKDVHKHHFDYTDLTPTEKQVFRRLIPFYTWTRKAIPYTIHMLATEPGRMNVLPKALRGLSVGAGFDQGNNAFPLGDYLTPSWLRDEMAVPVAGGLGGKDTIYLSPNASTMYSILNLVAHPTDPKSLLSSVMRMTTPALKIPYEESVGKQIGGGDIKSQGKYFQGQNPVLQYLEKIGGFGKHTPSDSTTIPNLLTGLGLVQNTKARQLSAAKHYAYVRTSGLKGKKRPVKP